MKKLNLEEIKNIELNLLKEFDLFCKQNNLTYFLCGGTLLGAIRHKGFIPWDDDIDVYMPRPDYEKFKSLTKEKPVKENIFTYTYDFSEHKTIYPFMKLIDTNTLVIEKYVTGKKTGIWIDIFPIDGLSSDNKLNEKLYKKNTFYKRVFRFCTNKASYTTNVVKKVLLILTKPFFKCVNLTWLCKKFDKTAQTYDYNTAEKAGVTIWGYGSKEIMIKKELFPVLKIEFENGKFNAPSNYDYYLSHLYGDYMQLPPEEKRVYHGFDAYLIEETK